MDASKFGLFIAQVRKENNMTQLELAQKLNVSDKTISKWETGKSLPDITMLEKLSQSLNISIVELINMEKDAEKTYSKDKVDEILVDFMNYNKRKKSIFLDWILATLLLFVFFSLLYLVAVAFPFVVGLLPWIATPALIVSVWRIYNKENYIVSLTIAVLIIGTFLSLIMGAAL